MIQKNEETKQDVVFVRDDLRKIMGVYNPEKEHAINAMGQVKN